MGHLITVATCSLNQCIFYFTSQILLAENLPGALDYDGNMRRILKAIELARDKGAKILNVPELAITGYGCLDHFLEGDLYARSKSTAYLPF